MGLLFYNGHLLSVSGHLSQDPACCCGGQTRDGCCDLADTLTGTMSMQTGAGSSMPATVTFTQTATFTWLTNTFAAPCPGASPTAGMTLSCSGDTWSLVGTGGLTGFTATLFSANCTTQTIVFDVSFDNGLGCGGTFRITIAP